MKKNYLLLRALFATLSAFSQLSVTFRSQLTFPGKSCANIWGYTDSLNREFALVGTTAGMSIVNVTNPTTPVLLFNIAGVNSQWREIKTHGKYAYVTTEGGAGLQIVNLSFLPDSAPSKLWTGNGAITGLSRIHALHIDGGFAYLYGCRNTGNSYLFNGGDVLREMPKPAVVKANHSSAQVMFVTENANLDAAARTANSWLNYDHHVVLREWAYGNVRSELLIEPFIGESEAPEDYKFWVCDGAVRFIQVDHSRFKRHTRQFYTPAWNRLDLKMNYPGAPANAPTPPHLRDMLRAAEKLYDGFRFVRVDLYDTPKGPLFGELTFTPEAGMIT